MIPTLPGVACAVRTPLHTAMFEERAMLLSRSGRHEQALAIYAYRLRDYAKATKCATLPPWPSYFS